MGEHFAAFSFVDRITAFDAGRSAAAQYAVPADIARFPSCLVAESVGQLAAWVAMERVGFRGRPVAALANETRFRGDVVPGAILQLAVEVESCDEDAVAYSGRASVDGSLVIELVDCLGPMLPVGEFDAPDELAARLAVLRGIGATPGLFRGVVAPRMVRHGGVPGQSADATLHVPESAAFFGDHFPRRPVFPATLLLDAQIGLAMDVAAESTHWPAGTKPAPARMTHVKMRSFIPPGAALEIRAELTPVDAATATLRLSARMDDKLAATARLDVAARDFDS